MVIGWRARHGLPCLLLGTKPSYSATPIIVTFMRLAQQIYREENDNTGSNKENTQNGTFSYHDK